MSVNARQVTRHSLNLCARSCRQLWLGVLAVAWADSFDYPRAGDGSSPSLRERNVRRARNWFGSRDFFEVCEMVGLDGQAVLEHWHRQQRQRSDEILAALGPPIMPWQVARGAA